MYCIDTRRRIVAKSLYTGMFYPFLYSLDAYQGLLKPLGSHLSYSMWFFLPISLDFSKITASLSVFLFSQEVKILRSFIGLSTGKLSPTTPLPCFYEYWSEIYVNEWMRTLTFLFVLITQNVKGPCIVLFFVQKKKHLRSKRLFIRIKIKILRRITKVNKYPTRTICRETLYLKGRCMEQRPNPKKNMVYVTIYRSRLKSHLMSTPESTPTHLPWATLC